MGDGDPSGRPPGHCDGGAQGAHVVVGRGKTRSEIRPFTADILTTLFCQKSSVLGLFFRTQQRWALAPDLGE